MIFSYLFQPNKSQLSPAGRAFIAWLEIVIIGTITAGAAAGLDYLNGHPGDFSGMLPIIESTVVISLLKALSVLSIPRANPTPAPVPAPVLQPPAESPPPELQPVSPLPQAYSPRPQFAPMEWQTANIPVDTTPWASIGGPPQARQP